MEFRAQFTPPATVYPPTQADEGAQIYYYLCLVCHGDRGQGLTEWRKQLEPQDQNCWQSKCHAPNRMDFGFTFPREVPALRNPGMLLTFQNAYNLYTFTKTYMPFQAPGSLKDEQYWQLTAFLMRLNGIDPGPQPLNAARAANISLVKPTPLPQPQPKWSLEILLIVILACAGALLAGVMLVVRRRKGSK